MLPVRCLAAAALLLLLVRPAPAQEEKKVLIFVAVGDARTNQELQGRAITSLSIDKANHEKAEFAKTMKIEGEPPRPGTYYKQVATLTLGKQTRNADLYFSDELPAGTKLMTVKLTGKFQGFISSIDGKAFVRPRKADLMLYEATAILPPPKKL